MRRLLIEADPRGDAALVDRVDRLYAAARDRPADPAERLATTTDDCRGHGAPAGGRSRALRPDPAAAAALRRPPAALWPPRSPPRLGDLPTGRQDLRGARDRSSASSCCRSARSALLVFFVPYQVTGFIARRVARQHDVIATAQVLTGLVVYGAWLAVIGALVWSAGGPDCRPDRRCCLLPIVAVAALFAIERESAVIDAVRAWWLLRRARRSTRASLRRRRSELADLLDEVNRWLNPAGG